jgi:hypothetical protein
MKRKISGNASDARSDAIVQPHLRFYHSESLRTKTLSVLDALEAAPQPTRQREALADLVLELTECGFEYYFVRPVQVAKVGFIAEQSTKIGIATILRVIGPVARRVIGGMDAQQLLSVSGYIRHLMG